MSRKAQLRSNDFLAELKAYADAQRTLIQAECDGFDTDATARDIRRTRATADFRFFARIYFPHYVKGAESLFHTWFYDNVPGKIDAAQGELINISAPRGEAKSTLGTQLLVLWCVVTARKHYMPIVMDSFKQSAAMLEAIKTELADNPRLQMDFPDACGIGRVWNAGVVLTASNVKLEAFGSDSRIRGLRHGPHRPDLVVMDDIENDKNVVSKDQRDKLEKLVTKSVLNLGPPEGTMDVLYLNTILHYDSVANRFHRKARWTRRKFRAVVRWPDRMDLWQQWEALFINEATTDDEGSDSQSDIGAAASFYTQHKADMDAGAIVSWPTVRPLIMLMMIRAEDHHAFDCEYQNDPTNDDNAFFTNMQYWVQPERKWVFHGMLDPSLGKRKKKGDPAAILVGGFDRVHGKLSVVEAAVARMLPERQLTKMIEFQRAWNCIVWGIEATAFQEYFRQQITLQSAALKMPLPTVPVQSHEDKQLKIEAMSPHVNNGLILFNQAHTVLNTQVRHWPEADHDDGPDCLAMLWALCLQRSFGIPKIRLGKRYK